MTTLEQELADDAAFGEMLPVIRSAFLRLLRALLIFAAALYLLWLHPTLARDAVALAFLIGLLAIPNLTKWAAVFALAALLAQAILGPMIPKF